MIAKDRILRAAIECARNKNYLLITREEIALEANVPPSLVSHHLGSMDDVRNAVITKAIEIEDHILIAQGIVFKHRATLDITKKLRHSVYLSIRKGGLD